MAASDFWGGPGPGAGDRGLALVPGISECQPTFSQRSQRSLPGPAGRLALHPAPATSGLLSRGGDAADSAARRPASRGPRIFQDPDFLSTQWLQALQEGGAPFDEESEPFRGNTARVAAGLQQNGVIDRLLAVVVTVKRCYSGEAFIRLKDPTGSIGGTLTRAVLEQEPDIRQGAVVRLCRVTVLRTPPPRSINHLCITLNSVVQVIPPPADSSQTAGAAVGTAQGGQQQQPRRIVPALPAPPPAASAQLPGQSWLSPPSSHQQQPQHPGQQPQPQQHQLPQQRAVHLNVARPAGAAPALSSQGMPPPAARQMPLLPPPPAAAPAPAPSSSFAWPPLLGGSRSPPAAQQWQQQPPPLPQQQPRPQQQQQQQTRPQQQQQSSTFQWPSLGGTAAAAAAGPGIPRPTAAPAWQAAAQPAASESVNFSMPNFSEGPKQWQQSAWQDDASSLPGEEAGGSQQADLPGSASQLFATSSQPSGAAAGGTAGGGAGAGWLQGLLAEAEYPVAIGLQQSQQAPAARRPPLANRQQQQQQRQQSPHAHGMPMTKRQRQQQSPALPAAGAVFAGADDLDLGDE